MAAIKRMRKQVDASLVVKRETLKRHRRLYLNVARIQEGYYRLAGLDELADRIRSREPGRRKQESSGDQPEDSEEESEDSEEAPEAAPPVATA